MLCLSRKLNESIIITDKNNPELEIKIQIIQTGAKVRLGFEMPDHIIIDREEIHLLRQAERKFTP